MLSDALNRLDIMLFSTHRINAPKRKEKPRQTSVQLYYKTLQMVYYSSLNMERQLGKATNDMINAICKHHLSKPMYANQKSVH